MNYQEIVDNLQEKDVINLLTKLGADRYKETEEAIIFPTICHNINSDEASMKLYYYKNSKIFYCYTSCQAQSIFKFLEHYYATREIEFDWYQDIYLPILNCTPKKSLEGFTPQKRELLREKFERQNKKIELQSYPKGILDVFVKKYPSQWVEEGISKKTMDKFNICFSISQNKIIIPHYDSNNRLVGIRGRAIDEWEVENIGKYMPVQIEQKWYSHPLSLNLYGLNQTKVNIKKTGVVYIFESEKAVLQTENFNIPNCGVAVCGSSLNKFQVDILMRECAPTEFIISFDKEKDNNDEYFNKLYKMCKKYSKYANFSFLYDFDNLLNLKDSPTDRGEEIFKKLLNRRVKVQ